jgi:hypothetical protein
MMATWLTAKLSYDALAGVSVLARCKALSIKISINSSSKSPIKCGSSLQSFQSFQETGKSIAVFASSSFHFAPGDILRAQTRDLQFDNS